MYRLNLSNCLLLMLIVLAANHDNFDEKYISKNEAIRTLVAIVKQPEDAVIR